MVETVWFLNTEVIIHVSSRENAHGFTVIEHHARAADSPPLHRHRAEDETFHVISGELRMVMDGQELQARAGQTIHIPKGASHTYQVLSDEGARFLTITGGGQFERFVRTLGRTPTRPGLPDPSGSPTPEEAEVLLQHCEDCGIEIVGPPLS